MNEQEWVGCDDPMPMLEFLQGNGVLRGVWCGYPGIDIAETPQPRHQRKLRLVGCAYCQMFLDCFKGNKPIRIIECAERFADGQATVRDLNEAGSDPKKW